MAGYSGTPLPKKLGIKPGHRVHFVDLPANVKAELKKPLADCTTAKANAPDLDFVMAFVRSSTELRKVLAGLGPKLAPAGMLWIAWPKKSSGVQTDVGENLVRELGLSTGLVDVKVCAVSDVWSGLKFVIRLENRPSGK
jgi:3-hydroxyisobutyrate dehydrogenase-like beta-hydroxyacid dehydrogenase